MTRVTGTITRPFKTLRRAWNEHRVGDGAGHRQERASPPNEIHAEEPVDNHDDKPAEEPVEQSIRYPDADYAEACRILHKRDRSQGLCEKCERWRRGIEDIHRKYEELRRELSDETARSTNGGGERTSPVTQPWSPWGQEHEQYIT
ncbi:hypothetical protein BR93DRAFT_969321 [Coniochaeta sp. PMI_546]|nr:hypothetical protein BR93DRAFT_969321 [Coniochaeta sp. PMI_546]